MALTKTAKDELAELCDRSDDPGVGQIRHKEWHEVSEYEAKTILTELKIRAFRVRRLGLRGGLESR